MTKKRTIFTINRLLRGDLVRRVEREGKTWFALNDVLAALVPTDQPQQFWHELTQREPQVSGVLRQVSRAENENEPTEVVDLMGVLRVAQAIRSPRSERVKAWLASTAV